VYVFQRAADAALSLCCRVRLGGPLALPSGRTPTVLPEKHFEQIANPALLYLLREGVMQRQLGIHLVEVSSAASLANDVAVLDQFGDDPMGASPA
jgi:hypothetical protein